jgi:hypothetical protein
MKFRDCKDWLEGNMNWKWNWCFGALENWRIAPVYICLVLMIKLALNFFDDERMLIKMRLWLCLAPTCWSEPQYWDLLTWTRTYARRLRWWVHCRLAENVARCLLVSCIIVSLWFAFRLMARKCLIPSRRMRYVRYHLGGELQYLDHRDMTLFSFQKYN